MTDHYSPVLGAGGDIDGALQEPIVPLLNYLRVPKFFEGYANLWAEHQNVSEDGYFVAIRIDRSSGKTTLVMQLFPLFGVGSFSLNGME